MRPIASGKGLLLSACLLCLYKPATAQQPDNTEHPVNTPSAQQAEISAVKAALKSGTLDLAGLMPATDPAGIFPDLEFGSAFNMAHPAPLATSWQQKVPGLQDANEGGRTGAEAFRQVSVVTTAGVLKLDVYVVSDVFHLDVPGLPRYEYTNTTLACYAAANTPPLAIVRYITRRADFLASEAKWMQAPPAWQAGTDAKRQALRPTGEGIMVYPNPARKEVALQFTLGEPGEVSVKVYNALGQLVDAPLTASGMQAGLRSYRYDVAKLPPGTYTIKALIRDKIFTASLTTL